MITPVNNTNAIYTAREAYKSAVNHVDDAARQVAEKNAQADNMAALEIAKQNAKVQTANLKSALQHGEQIIDILVK